jgi:hypothetical protein
MKKSTVENLKIKDLLHVLTPLKRGRVLKDYVDIGFDTEFTAEENSADRELISLQFSLGKSRSVVYYVGKRSITSAQLLDYVLQFLKEQHVEPSKHIYLIAHFAIAELSKISDFYDEYAGADGFNVRPKVSEFNKAIRWERKFGDVTLHIADLFGHMKTSLEKIGLTLGYEKLKISCDGKDHKFWIENMKELSVKHRDVYENYAIRDAEIAVQAWKELHDRYATSNLDCHLYTTYTSLAVAEFRRRMQRLPCKTEIEKVIIKQKMKNGEWREHVAKKLVYADNLDTRYSAALSYWGGNNQAFVRGYFPDVKGTQWDFISLYIIAGILQPLSNEHTVYRQLTIQDVLNGAEGFCQTEFEFPIGTTYPCLPVQEDYYPKLMFTLKGVSYCTISELRQALHLNVNIKSFRGYGFYPEQNEIEHELKPFLIGMLENKSRLDESGKRASIEREIEKAKMVGIIGRFAYMKPSRTAEDIAHLLHESSIKTEEFRRYGRKKAVMELTERSEVGGTWHIEWASLILGKARSLAAYIIRQGEKCLSISTDGGFWLGNPHFENSELHKQLSAFHSGIRLEGEFDELFIARNRVYVAWNKGQVLHSAMMGIAVPGENADEKKINFERMVRESLNAGKEVCAKNTTKRLTGLTDYIFNGTPLNTRVNLEKNFNWDFDGKRKVACKVNPFKDNCDTVPYATVDEAFRDFYKVKEPHRPRTKLTDNQIAEIIKNEETVRALAKKYGVSAAYIAKVKERAR